MKNAMKKLMSLLLVAVLVIGMIPFGASAEEATAGVVLHVYHQDEYGTVSLYKTVGTSATVDQLASEAFGIPADKVENMSINVNGVWTENATTVTFTEADHLIYIVLKEGQADTNTGSNTGSNTDTNTGSNTDTNTGSNTDTNTGSNTDTNTGSEVKSYDLSIDVNGVQKVMTNGTTASYEDCLAAAGIDTSKVKVTEAVYQYTAEDGRIPNYNFGPGDVITLTAPTRVFFFTEALGQTSQQPTQQPTQTTGEATLKVYVNGAIKVNSKVVAGKTVNAMLAASSLDFASAWTSYYTVDTITINGVSYNRVDVTAANGDAVEVSLVRKYSKDNSHKVYLHVYLNGNAGSIAKTLDITSTYLMYDWATDVTEVKNYLSANFYNAANANGLQLDGLYITPGHFPTNYYSDSKQSAYTADQLRNDLESNHVNISVMLKNAVVKGSAAADKSNPKTGDSIYTAFTVMGLSAASLAAVMYFYNKKRYTV